MIAFAIAFLVFLQKKIIFELLFNYWQKFQFVDFLVFKLDKC